MPQLIDTLTRRDLALDLGHQIDLLKQLEASLRDLQGHAPVTSPAASALLLARLALHTTEAHIRTAATALEAEVPTTQPSVPT